MTVAEGCGEVLDKRNTAMIGDTLFDCGESLDHYLSTYDWPIEVEARVRALRDEIGEVQRWLDSNTFENVGNVRIRETAAASIAQWIASGSKYPPRHSPGRG
jgi:hypothetical protein